jgi:hypothetical protein
MGASEQLRSIGEKARRHYNAVFQRLPDLALNSIRDGSPLTGAPGQPVGRGELRDSWTRSDIAPGEVLLSTRLPYARQEEDGISYAHGGEPIQQHAGSGGPHSVKLTAAGMQRLVDQAVDDELRTEA